MIISTKRLILREMNENDFDALKNVFCHHDTMRFYPYKFDDARVKYWIDVNIEKYATFGFGLFAMCLKDTGEVIGDCGLTMQKINGVIRPEIGYHVRYDMQKKGFAKEAAAAVRDWVFENTTYKKVYSYMVSDNVASYNTAMSVGMKKVDDYFENDLHLVAYSISKSEWQSLKNK